MMMRHVGMIGFSLIFLTSCGGVASLRGDPPVQGLAADQAGLDAEGNPIDAATTGEPSPDAADDGAEPVPAPADPPRTGFFGRLFGGGRAAGADESDGGLFGAANAAPGGGTAPEIVKGKVLPFGAVATVCGMSAREMGGAVDQSPRDGRARWKLHDPIPASTGPRTQYVTGFRDRCARQVTGALVLFGSADVHETTRYAASNTRPYSATDTAYEKVKSRLCGVRPNVPCPADRQARLNKAVSFVTVYPRFGATSEWYELLLVDGQLSASALSGR